MRTIELRFVDTRPGVRAGVTWGVPMPSGSLQAADAAHLRRADGGALPTQTWPLAFWPDGSIKWLGCAAVVGPDDGEALTLSPGPGPSPARAVRVEQLGIEIFRRVSTGAIVADVGDRGTAIIQEISLPGGTTVNGPCGASDGDGRRVIAGDSLSPRGVFTSFIEPLSGQKIAQSNLSTNHDSQWALNAIAALALASEAVDAWWKDHGGRPWPTRDSAPRGE